MGEMKDMLFNRLHALMDKGQSGVIAILDDETVVMWINPLRTVLADGAWGDQYRECATAGDAECAVSSYAQWAVECLADDDRRFEDKYFQESLEHLVWIMAHEDSANPDGDLRDEADNLDYDLFMGTSVTGAATLESDIAAFLRMKSENGEIEMELRAVEGGVGKFCISHGEDGYVLSKEYLEPFTDDETGKMYQITRLEPILWSDSPGALYARYRALLAVKQ